MKLMTKIVTATILGSTSLFAMPAADAQSCPSQAPTQSPIIPFFGLNGVGCPLDIEVYAQIEQCVSYEWNLLLSPNDPVHLGNGDSAAFTVPEGGAYTVSLRRWNQYGSHTTYKTINVTCDGGFGGTAF